MVSGEWWIGGCVEDVDVLVSTKLGIRKAVRVEG